MTEYKCPSEIELEKKIDESLIKEGLKKMSKEFNLSEKIFWRNGTQYIKPKDVKEFIRDSIEDVQMELVTDDGCCMECGFNLKKFKKRAGSSLIEKEGGKR